MLNSYTYKQNFDTYQLKNWYFFRDIMIGSYTESIHWTKLSEAI